MAARIRPASPVNVVGRVEGDATVFRQVRDGTPVLIELLADDAPEDGSGADASHR